MATEEQNPLLTPRFRIPFDKIRAEQVEPAATELLRQAREGLQKIASAPEPRTYENTLQALDELTEPLDYAMGVVRHLESVATYPELRAAFNAVQPEVSAFYSGIPLNEGLWNGFKAFAATPEGDALAGARKRFLTKTMDTFRRHGAELDAAGKKRLEEIDVELTQAHHEIRRERPGFHQRIRAGDRQTKRGLAGLPPTALESARAQRRSARDARAGASRCRRRITSR